MIKTNLKNNFDKMHHNVSRDGLFGFSNFLKNEFFFRKIKFF